MTATRSGERPRRWRARCVAAAGSVWLSAGAIAFPAAGRGEECLYSATPFSDLVAIDTRTLAVDDILPRAGVVRPPVRCRRIDCTYEIAAPKTWIRGLVILGDRAYMARDGPERESAGTLEVGPGPPGSDPRKHLNTLDRSRI
ncbi:hypothetical protein L6Q96_19180 [Candidatus Binatia bacterium]|nr:hypothetical protein [Candidatus Binatia bacterium]